mgnify:FL=1
MDTRFSLVPHTNRKLEIRVKNAPRQIVWHYARIFRAFRRYNMLKEVAAEHLREHATKGIQGLVRRRRDGGNMKPHHFHIGAFAAGSIQRLQRGNMSRVRARQSKHRHSQRLVLSRYCSTKGDIPH